MSSGEHRKSPERVAAGLRASIHNPHVSQEAKEHASQRLQEMGQDIESKHPHAQQAQPAQPESSRVLGGYKATLRNENTSEEAKAHAREVLEASGIHEAAAGDKEHNTRVIAGYKAALHNPKVSPEAKQHAREWLEQHEAL